jgi:RNA polymerase sigma factor (sigma-70 family)
MIEAGLPTGADQLAAFFREEAGRIAGALTRVIGSFELAEDAVQEAFAKATERWPVDGLPDNPAAWLTTVARNAALDRIRRDAVGKRKLQELEQVVPSSDDRLRLIFTCCHPALSRDAQLALTLRAVCGFQPGQIGAALLVSEAAVAQRLARARRKIADARIPFRIPNDEEIDERLKEVLAVLYLMFNEGYLSSAADATARADLAEDASWLAAMLVSLYPREAEAVGLLALMWLQRARTRARFDERGALVLLPDQDRRLWDASMIAEGVQLLKRAAALGDPGSYQLQGAIVACHSEAASILETDWQQIVALYDMLLALQPSPVIRLNRAIALAQVAGAAAGLREVDTLEGSLTGYHLFHATRGRFLVELGRDEQARAAELKAARLTENPGEQELLARRLQRPSAPDRIDADA